MNLCIIIPAYNEALRIEKTVRDYDAFFLGQSSFQVEFLIVLNGCTDATDSVVLGLAELLRPRLSFIRVAKQGKGNAVKVGFDYALSRGFDLIGFVDADMATRPFYFFDLVRQMEGKDGVIASRYMPHSQIYPPRPLIKRWGSRFIYEGLIKSVLKMDYYDFQCGAKIFNRTFVAAVVDHITIDDWAFDIELLYLAKKLGFTILEHPTVWYDQTGSKMTLRAGFRMLVAIFIIWWRHHRKKPLVLSS
jgi:dolichyl-phosphate beta-glucosyltransferase